MLPRSRIMISPFRVFTLTGGMEWRNRDYELKDEPGSPSAFTLNEWLVTGGLSLEVAQDNRISAEIGTYLVREIKGSVADSEVNPVKLSEEWLVRIGWHGAF